MERLHLRTTAALMTALCLLMSAAGCEKRVPPDGISDPEIVQTGEPAGQTAGDENVKAGMPETDPPGMETDPSEADASEAETDPPETDAAETDAPETDPPETEPKIPETETPGTEAPETESPETEVPETEPADTDMPGTDEPAPDGEGQEEEPAETEEPEETNIAGVPMTEVLRLRERDKEAARKAEEAKKEEERRAKGAYSYLTGLPCTPVEQNKRPVAIMLNNLKMQLPQFGLDYGEIFYECVTEGSITRLMMLTTNYEAMGTVGSIRSSREVFANRVPDYDAIYVHAGGSPGAYTAIAELKLDNLDGANMYLPSTYFRDQWRLNNVGYEHSLMTNGAGIVSGIQFKGYRTELRSGFTPAFTFYSEENNNMTGGPAAEHVRLYATPIQTVDYVYDKASGQYLRYHYNGIAHKDGTTGGQIAVKNVLVLFMDIGVIPGDEASRVDVTDVGSGSGYYMTNGQRAEIVWSRSGSSDVMHYTYPDGTPLVLNAGKTFINIVEKAAANTISFNYQW